MKRITTIVAILVNTSLFGLYDTTPFSYTLDVENGDVLVMIGPPITEQNYPYFDRVSEWAKEREKELRERFPQSGLYRRENDEFKPVWRFEGFSHLCDISANGRFLVSMDYIWQEEQDRIVRFYDKGKFLMAHNITDILDGRDYGREPSPASFYRKITPLHEHEPAYWGVTDNDTKFSFESMNGDILVFDLATGEIEKSYNINNRALAILLLLFILIAGMALFFYYRNASNTPLTTSTSTRRLNLESDEN